MLAATRITVFPGHLDAVSFVPFCVVLGGLASAFWHCLQHGFDEFPAYESSWGAFLGGLFGRAFVAFGASGA